MDARIRPAVSTDLNAINDIHNYFVINTTITFYTEPMSLEERQEWFEKFSDSGRYRLFTAIVEGEIVGFAGSARYRTPHAYDTSVETSVYVAPGTEGRGVGRSCMERC